MKRILVPTDLSELGDYAYNIAHRIANTTKAEIHLMSVVTAPVGAIFSPEGELIEADGMNLDAYAEELRGVQAAIKQYADSRADIKSTSVPTGTVNDEVLKYIKEENIDLVVMGTHGATGIQEVVIGSHAEHIVRHSPVPVVSLKCDRSAYEIKDILFACDFAKREKVNIDPVVSIAEAFNARINFLEVNTATKFRTQREIQQSMRDFAELHDLEIGESQMHIYADESVEKGIQNFCADTGIDFLAIATHQRKGLARFFNSSLSEDIVNHNYQPVMTFPIH